MVTPEINENCHYVQNAPHRRKINLEKLHLDTLCCLELLRKVSQGGGRNCPPSPVKPIAVKKQL